MTKTNIITQAYLITGAKFRPGELRIDEETQFQELENENQPHYYKMLPDVNQNITEVKATVVSISDDSWYYGCDTCKKGCSQVCNKYIILHHDKPFIGHDKMHQVWLCFVFFHPDPTNGD